MGVRGLHFKVADSIGCVNDTAESKLTLLVVCYCLEFVKKKFEITVIRNSCGNLYLISNFYSKLGQ